MLEKCSAMSLEGGLIVGSYNPSTEICRKGKNFKTPKGRKVVFLGKGGTELELELVKNKLEIGQILTVKEIYIGGFKSEVEFLEVEGVFNTVMFDDYIDGGEVDEN